MSTMNLQLYLYAVNDSDPDSESGMLLKLIDEEHKFLMRDEEINIGLVTCTFIKPEGLTEESLRRMAVETLREKQKKLQADAYRAEQILQGKIDKLLLLTHDQNEVGL